MTDPVSAWRQEHQYFSRLLRLMRKQVDLFHAGGEPNYELMRDVVWYLRDYSDALHHPREDVAFERLARYCPEVELVLARLQQEHRVIAHSGEKLLALIESVLEGSFLPREQLEAAAATYLIYYENHISTEESTVLGRAAEHLTGEDWEAVRTAVVPMRDPLFGPDPQERFRELRRHIEREAQSEP